MKEIWKDIESYEGRYQISTFGRIKSLNYNKTGKSKVLKPHNSTEYSQISLGRKQRCKYIHRLVLETFRGKSKLFCNHINGNKRDNKLENLEYCTHKENMAHAVKMDLCPKGENHYEAKITESQVRYIKTVFKNCEVEYGYWAKVARSLNVIPGTISAIVTNRSWKHIKV